MLFEQGLAFIESPSVLAVALLLQRLQSIPFAVAVHKEGGGFWSTPSLSHKWFHGLNAIRFTWQWMCAVRDALPLGGIWWVESRGRTKWNFSAVLEYKPEVFNAHHAAVQHLEQNRLRYPPAGTERPQVARSEISFRETFLHKGKLTGSKFSSRWSSCEEMSKHPCVGARSGKGCKPSGEAEAAWTWF